MRAPSAGICLGLTAFLLGSPAVADPVADFYRGRTFGISVGFGPGGGYDQHARLLARHIGRHIPGEPRVVVKNVPGAAGLVLANWLYNVAPRDGSEIATFNRTVPIDPIIDGSAAQFDTLKFTWIGSTANDVSTCISRADGPAKNFEETLTKEVLIAGTGPTADANIYPKLLNITVGSKFRMVNGYQGSADSLLAMERGEVHGFCGIGWTNIEANRPDWLRDKKIVALVQFGMAKHPDHPETPLALDLAKNERDRRAIELLSAPLLFARPFAAPPGVPAERTAALRKAFADTMKDPEYLAEAKRQKLDVEHVPAAEVEKVLARLFATPKDVVERVKGALQ